MHSVRTAKSAVTPRPIKQMRRALNPIDNAVYSVERSLKTKPRRRSTSPAYRHGDCPVAHRTADAASRCRNLLKIGWLD